MFSWKNPTVNGNESDVEMDEDDLNLWDPDVPLDSDSDADEDEGSWSQKRPSANKPSKPNCPPCPCPNPNPNPKPNNDDNHKPKPSKPKPNNDDKPKRKRKRRPPPDPGRIIHEPECFRNPKCKPKYPNGGNHGANAFILFFQETLKKEGGNFYLKAKECGERWWRMSDSQKNKYRKMYCASAVWSSQVCKRNAPWPKRGDRKRKK